MYPLGSLTAALQNARRRLLDVFEPPDSEATREQRTVTTAGSIGRLAVTKLKPTRSSSIPGSSRISGRTIPAR
jgi:hypothetical protein